YLVFFISLTLLYYLLFLMQESGANLDLHSFPTRRSSDLVRSGWPVTTSSTKNQTATVAAPTRPVIKPRVSSGWSVTAPNPNGPSDRKSTRLNSSHGSISYAVFCLKKKNKNNESNRTSTNR